MEAIRPSTCKPCEQLEPMWWCVALGVGMGAVFSQFDWEYSAQLSTNLGSFIFMFCCLVVLGLDLIPLSMMFGGYMLMADDPTSGILSTSSLTIVGCLGMLFVLNRALAAWALSTGARALMPK